MCKHNIYMIVDRESIAAVCTKVLKIVAVFALSLQIHEKGMNSIYEIHERVCSFANHVKK